MKSYAKNPVASIEGNTQRPPKFVTVKEAAAIMRSSARFIQGLMYSGQLKYCKVGHKVLIFVDSLRKLIDEGTVDNGWKAGRA